MAHKFHINDKGEVKPCDATVRKCGFMGFDDAKEAEAYVLRTSSSLESLSKSKPAPPAVLAELRRFGLGRGLTTTASESEVIDIAFQGNRQAYKNFVQLSARGNDELQPATMKGIGKFVAKGVAVDTTTDFDTPTERSGEKFNASEVDLIETPSRKGIAESLIKEFGKPF